MLKDHYLRTHKSFQVKVFTIIAKYHNQEREGWTHDYKTDTYWEYPEDFLTGFNSEYDLEDIDYCGGNYVHDFTNDEHYQKNSKEQLVVDVLSSLTNYKSQTICWLRNDIQKKSIRILIQMGFEVLMDTKNVNSDKEVKLLGFDWYDEDCISKLRKFVDDKYNKSGALTGSL